MNSAAKELAVTRQIDTVGGACGRRNDNLILWVLIIIVIFCFCGNDGGIFGNWGSGYDCRRKHHHHKQRNSGFFGENGWFILIIFAILFLFNDGIGGANTNIINVDTEDGQL
ncbi:hypothetical protein M2651_01945 [Clostridium sp. SYSU_GA19001]|uniref:hypothetical protein n=1 Tax=Clostridium caldaquaticum TaxID=2940653 RepID=UPI002077747C|nr:hypothetical protein [Clostridium caldaquaticum]MCM8709783.1 hypothetical protein [Clostridium caldaquaticum]